MSRNFIVIPAFEIARDNLIASNLSEADIMHYSEKVVTISDQMKNDGFKFLGASVLLNVGIEDIPTILRYTDSADYPLTVNLDKSRENYYIGPPRITDHSNLNYLRNAIGFWAAEPSS